MITRVLTASLLLSGTCLQCFAQEPSIQAAPGTNASVVSKGRPMIFSQTKVAEGVDTSHSPTAGPDVACMPRMGHEPHLKQIMERSGVTLSDEQVEQMISLRSDLMKNLMPKKDHMITLAGDLKETLTAPAVNDDQARRIFADMKTDLDAAYAKFVEHVIAVSHVFTADQRQKLKVAVDRWSLGPLGRTAPLSPPVGKGP